MLSTNLDQLFSDFEKVKVLIVGDVMVDSYIFGKVDRISPEAPVPVIDVQRLDARLGGAGNVALNLKSLGAKVTLCTCVGTDKEGEEMKQLLQKAGISDKAIHYSEKRKTTTKTRIIGNNAQIARIDHEKIEDLDTLDSYLLQQHFERELEDSQVVIMEDYNKGVLHKDNIELLIGLAKKAGVPVVVDPKKANFLCYKGATLFKPNLKEIKEGLKLEEDLRELDNLKKAVNTLEATLGNEISMVTMSECGVYIRSKTQEHHLPAHIRNIADVSGAGDTVISVAALCLALNTPLDLLAELSNLAGGLVCEKTGVVPINKTDLLQEAKSVL